MRKYQMSLGVFITSLILLTGFKKNTGQQNIPSKKSADISNHGESYSEPPKVNIADVIAVKGDAGKRSFEVLVCLSKVSSNKVTMNYNTKNGSAKSGVDYTAISGSISFEPGETAKRIPVFIIGDVAADPDEDAAIELDITFEVNLNNAIGGIIEKSKAIITIIKNIAMDPRISGGNLSVYEVRFTFTGYTSLGTTAEECDIRSNGKVVLTGLLKGRENVLPGDDITYTGTLQLDIDMDICSAFRNQDGEDKLCGITVDASGAVYTELEIYYGTDTTGAFDGRGGYIQIENKDGRFLRTAVGSCDEEQVMDERMMVPNKSIASIFNGKDLPMLKSRTLRNGTYSETDEQGNKTVVQVRKIR